MIVLLKIFFSLLLIGGILIVAYFLILAFAIAAGVGQALL